MKRAWFGKYWTARRGRYRYMPITWQGWVALIAAILAPHMVWLVPGIRSLHPLIVLAISMAILMLAILALFRLVRARNVEIAPEP